MKKKILHITAHLGGGVGKAVSTLIKNDKKFSHEVICLEKPINYKFYNIIKKKNKIIITNKILIIKKYLDKADIVQIEFWNHPLLLKTLVSLKNLNQRIILWAHQSGIKYPRIPKKILKNKNIEIVFSSKRSLSSHKKNNKGNFHFISSASCNYQKKNIKKPFFKCFYMGSFHQNKIYKNFISLISNNLNTIGRFDMYGENELKKNFLNIVKIKKLEKKIYVHGYKNKVYEVFKKNSVLLYFLDKDHYGTGENILIESMSAGVVPVVLNNSLEASLIKNNVNGVILKNENDLANILIKLRFNNKFRENLRKNCIKFANNNFNSKLLVKKFDKLYIKKNKQKKFNFNFKNMLGNNAFEIFKNFLDKNKIEIKKILSSNKGGIFHFEKYFKNDLSLLKILEKSREAKKKLYDF